MKKLVLILALMVLIPCSAFGLEMLNDTTLDGVTGQSGINIAVDDIQLFLNIEKMAWIDCDGFDSAGRWKCQGNGGALVLNNFQIDVLNINAIVASVTGSVTGDNQSGTNMGLLSVSCGRIPLFYNYANSAAAGCGLSTGMGAQTAGLDNHYGAGGSTGHYFTPQFLSIDVTDRLPASTEGLQFWATHFYSAPNILAHGGTSTSTVGGVLIGLPTVEIYINDMSMEPLYDGDLVGQTSTALNDDSHTWNITGDVEHANFGVIQMHGITFTVLSGWVEISPK